MARSDNFRRQRELINEIERQKSIVEKFGVNSWKMTLRGKESVIDHDFSKPVSNINQVDKVVLKLKY